MGRLDLATLEDKIEFGREFLPPVKGYQWRLSLPGESKPLRKPTPNFFGVPVAMFRDAGLRLPLDPLLLRFMNTTRIPFNCLSMNVVRVILSVSALNRKLNLQLSLRDIFYCYKLGASSNGLFHFQAHPGAPDLILCLPGSQKGLTEASIVILEGPVLPEEFKDFQFPRLADNIEIRLPVRTDLAVVNREHLNVALAHQGFGSPSLFDHPRACHNLLGYQWRHKSVNKRRAAAQSWVGQEYNWAVRLVLFAGHGVESDACVAEEAELRQRAQLPGEDGVVARNFVREYELAVARHAAYCAQRDQAEATAAETLQAGLEVIARGEGSSSESSAAVLTRWGYIVVPEETAGEVNKPEREVGQEPIDLEEVSSSTGYSPSVSSEHTHSDRAASEKFASTSRAAEMPPLSITERLKKKRLAALADKGVLPAKKARTEEASAAAELPAIEAVSSTPANRPIELVGTNVTDLDELEIQESPLKRKGKNKASPKKKGGSSAEVWVPDFGKDVVYVTDSVSKPEVALKVARHTMLPADEEYYQSLSLGSLRKEFASAALLVKTIGSALDAVHTAEAENLKKDLETAKKNTQDVPKLKADLAAEKKKTLTLEGAKSQVKQDLALKKKELAELRKHLEAAVKRAEDAEGLLEAEKTETAKKVKAYDAALASNELTLNYWRPKIFQHGYDLCLNQVLAGVAPAELPKVVDVPPGWWGDERDCLPDQDFTDFPPEEASVEEAPVNDAADV